MAGYAKRMLALGLVVGSLAGFLGAADWDLQMYKGIEEEAQKLSIEVRDAEFTEILSFLNTKTGLNFIADDEALKHIAGLEDPLVDLRLVDVTWEVVVDELANKFNLIIERKAANVVKFTYPPHIRLTFKETPLNIILKTIAAKCGKNIVIDPGIGVEKTNITLTLVNVPWDVALDTIVKSAGFTWTSGDYDIIRITTPENIQKDSETRLFRLNWAQPIGFDTQGATGSTKSELMEAVASVLTKDGKLNYDPRTNTLVVKDVSSNMADVEMIIKGLDVRTKQVMIETKIISIDSNDAKDLGMKWAAGLGFSYKAGGIGNVLFPFAGGVDGWEGSLTGGPGADISSVTSSSFAKGTLDLGKINFLLQLLHTYGSTEIIQTPTLLTLDNTKAFMKVGTVTRYAEFRSSTDTSGTSSSGYQEASGSPVNTGISLELTPHITEDGFVQIRLKPKTSDLIQFLSFGAGTAAPLSLPETVERELESVIQVKDGATGIIAGLLYNKEVQNVTRIPLLSSIPILKHLFTATETQQVQRELMFLITPRIVREDEEEVFRTIERLKYEITGQELRDRELQRIIKEKYTQR
ncbi:MAG: secretin N-terminal domain-containing protein [Planctomycetota bacterium]